MMMMVVVVAIMVMLLARNVLVLVIVTMRFVVNLGLQTWCEVIWSSLRKPTKPMKTEASTHTMSVSCQVDMTVVIWIKYVVLLEVILGGPNLTVFLPVILVMLILLVVFTRQVWILCFSNHDRRCLCLARWLRIVLKWKIDSITLTLTYTLSLLPLSLKPVMLTGMVTLGVHLPLPLSLLTHTLTRHWSGYCYFERWPNDW